MQMLNRQVVKSETATIKVYSWVRIPQSIDTSAFRDFLNLFIF